MKPIYLEHFGIAKAPFELSPDRDFLFAGIGFARTYEALRHIVVHDRALTVISGEVGAGKTLLAKCLLAQLPDNIDAIFLANPSFSRDEILFAIADELGLNIAADSKRAVLAALREAALNRHTRGRSILIVIDEAHLMPPESVEEVRLLTNIETDSEKLFAIVLIGQPELESVLLAREDLRQVRDRVKYWLTLEPMPENEIDVYLEHRLRIAGRMGGRLFTTDAAHEIWRAAGGRPRRINLIADRALLAAYVDAAEKITPKHVKDALQEMKNNPVRSRRERTWMRLWIAGLAMLVLAAGLTALPHITQLARGGKEERSITAVPASVGKADAPRSLRLETELPLTALSTTQSKTRSDFDH